MKILRDGQEVEVEENYELQENESLVTTPPTTEPSAGVDPSVLSAYQQQLLQQARDNQRLQRELDDARRVQQAPQAPTDAEEKAFFDKPHSTVAEIVRRELQQQTAPLNQFVQQTQRQQGIENLKSQMKTNAAQFPYITQVEGMFDQIMQQAQIVDANSAIVAYNTAVGYFVSNGGTIAPSTPVPQNNTQPNRPVPPHIRPTPPVPSPQNGGGSKKVRALNENERKIARFNGMSDVEYLVYTEEISPREVAKISDDEVKRRVGGTR